MTAQENQNTDTNASTIWNAKSQTVILTCFGVILGGMLYLAQNKLIEWLDAEAWFEPVSLAIGVLYTLSVLIIDRQSHGIDLLVERTKALEGSTNRLREDFDAFRGDIEKHSFLSKELTAGAHSKRFLLPVEPITVAPFPRYKIAKALDVINCDEFQNLFYSETYVAYLVQKSFHCEDGEGQRLIVTTESTKSLSIFVSIVHSLNQPLYIMHRVEYIKLIKRFASILYRTNSKRKIYEKFIEVALGNPTFDTLEEEVDASNDGMDTKYLTHDGKIDEIPAELIEPLCIFIRTCMSKTRVCSDKEDEMSAVLSSSLMSDTLVREVETAAKNLLTGPPP